jgi:hypothetical protein
VLYLESIFSFHISVGTGLCFKVSNAAYCCTSIWQLKCIFYFNIASYVQLLMSFEGEKVKSPNIQLRVVFFVMPCYTLGQNSRDRYNEE